MADLTGKTVLLTAAAQGIGHAGVIDDDQLRRAARKGHLGFMTVDGGDITAAAWLVLQANIHTMSPAAFAAILSVPIRLVDFGVQDAERRPALSGQAAFPVHIGFPRRSVAILLNARGAQARQTVIVDRRLPGQEFLNGERIALTGFLQAQQATAHRCDNFRLATDHPTARIGRGQISNRQRAAIRADDIFHSWTYHFGHWHSLHKLKTICGQSSLPHLKIA